MTANWRKWTGKLKVLNECISALWDDVRHEVDENVIPRVGPLSGFLKCERSQAAALAALESPDGGIRRLRFSDVQCLPEGWQSHLSARFQIEIPACFSSHR